MTSIGHSLTGIAIGVLSLPPQVAPRRTFFHIAAFTVLANIPDLSLPGWWHDRYYFSHSLYVNLLLMLLDSFYNHGLGVAIFWPFSEGRLVLPLPWFSIMDGPLWSWQALRISLIEVAFYLPLIGLAVWYRKIQKRT